DVPVQILEPDMMIEFFELARRRLDQPSDLLMCALEPAELDLHRLNRALVAHFIRSVSSSRHQPERRNAENARHVHKKGRPRHRTVRFPGQYLFAANAEPFGHRFDSDSRGIAGERKAPSKRIVAILG